MRKGDDSATRRWHGAGAPQTQRFMVTVLTDFDEKKKIAKKVMGMKEDEPAAAAAAKK